MPSNSGMLWGPGGARLATTKARAVIPTPIAYQRRAERVVSITGAHSTFQVLGRKVMATIPATAGTLTPCWCSRKARVIEPKPDAAPNGR